MINCYMYIMDKHVSITQTATYMIIHISLCNSHGQSPQVVSILYDCPSHNLPPLDGNGLLHVLTRNLTPLPPCGTEHFDTSIQGDQPPSTKRYGNHMARRLKSVCAEKCNVYVTNVQT